MSFYLTLLSLLILKDVIQASVNQIEERNASLPLWPNRRWPNGVVYYKFFPKNSFNASELAAVKDTMKSIEKDTCIRFVEQDGWNKGVVRIHKTQNSTDPCIRVDEGYSPNRTTEMLLGCFEVTPYNVYYLLMNTLSFTWDEKSSDETEYCNKYRFIPEEKTSSGKSVRAVDGAQVLNRREPTEEEKDKQKFAKKINSLYCCKKKTGSGRKRDQDLLVSSNLEAEVDSLDELEPEIESSSLYRSSVNAMGHNNNKKPIEPKVERSESEKAPNFLKPEMERMLGSIFPDTQKDLTGLLNQLGSKVSNAGQSSPMKQVKKPLQELLGKAENLEANLPLTDLVNDVNGHRKQHSFDPNALEYKLMGLLNGNNLGPVESEADNSVNLLGNTHHQDGHRNTLEHKLMTLLNNNNNLDPVESEADNLINLLGSKNPPHIQDGHHQKFVSQNEAIREVLAQYVNRVTNSKQNYAHNAYAYNGGGGQGQGKCEKIIKLLLQALREKTEETGGQNNPLQSLLKNM